MAATAGAAGADVRSALTALAAADDAVRGRAEAHLSSLRSADSSALMSTLAGCVGDKALSDEARMQAAIYWKNMLDPSKSASVPGVASEEQRLERLAAGWKGLGNRGTMRNQAIAAVMEATDWQEQRTASLVIGKIRLIEGADGWPELFPGLLTVLDNGATAPALRRGMLTCASVVADELPESDVDQDTVNKLLSHAVKTLQPDVTDHELQQAGVECLLSLLDFCEPIFTEAARKPERDYLVNVFVTAAGHPVSEVREKALTGLCNMVRWYYAAMPEYMGACHAATDRVIKAIADEGAQDGIMAMEFWATLGEKEASLIEAGEPCHRLLTRIATTLAPSMWEVLTTKRDAADPTPTSMQVDTTAAHVASEVLRQVIIQMGADAVPLFAPLVEANFAHADWRVREGALSVLGFLTEGVTDTAALAPLASKYFPVIMGRLGTTGDHETDPRIRPPLAWCAGMLLDTHFATVAVVGGRELVTPSLGFLTALLGEAPVTAAKAAFAISSLAVSARRNPRPAMAGAPAGSWIGPDQASATLRALVSGMSRPDGGDMHFAIDAMDSFGDVTACLGPECLQIIVDMLKGIAGAIPSVGAKIVAAAKGSAEFGLFDQQLGCLTGTLCYVVTAFSRLRNEAGPAAAAVVADGEAQLPPLVAPLLATIGIDGATASLDGFRALGAVVNALGPAVAPAVGTIGPVLVENMNNHRNAELCMQAVHATASLVTAMDEGVAPYVATFFAPLKGICTASSADPDIKPEAIGAIGDLAAAAGPAAFAPHVHDCAGILEGASGAATSAAGDPDDEDGFDWAVLLRARTLAAYSGILTMYIGCDETTKSSLRGIGQQAVRMARALAIELATMSEARRNGLSFDYVTNMCTVLADAALLFSPGGIASEAAPSMKWLQDLCAFADTHCTDKGEVAYPGRVCAHVITHGSMPA